MTPLLLIAMVIALQGDLIVPQRAAADPHIQVAQYNPNIGVMLRGHLGYQIAIELEPGERIENVAIGDAVAWQITPSKRADTLFAKPVGVAKPTNMTIITDRRTYSFALSVAPAREVNETATWILRFKFPTPPAPVAHPLVATAELPKVRRNEDYTSVGPGDLLPSKVFDDGTVTYFAWPPEVAMPAIFAVNSDASESLVNFNVRDGLVVVQQTAGRFVLRRGASFATVSSTPGTTKRLVSKSGNDRHDQ